VSDPNAKNVADHEGAPAENAPPRQVLDGPAIYEQTNTERRKQQRRRKLRKAPVWIESACAIALVGITGFYTHYAHQQVETAQNTLGEIIKQYPLIQQSSQAATDAADTAENTLVLANRPWIKIKHRIVKPLDFGFTGAAGPAATMSVEDTIENVGNGVALNVLSWEDVLPVDPDESTTSAVKRRAEWCDANKQFDPKSRTTLNGNILFPKDPLIQISGMGPLIKTINKAARDNDRVMGPWYKGNGPNPLAGKVALVMVGCVVYRSSFEKDGTRPHMTGFLYRLGEPQQSGGFQPFVTPSGIADKLQLIHAPDGFFAY